MLVRLLYASRATGPIDDAVVESILEDSHEYNLEHGITGLLCATQGGDVFLQALEGGRAAVNTIYNRIVSDARHRDVTLLDYAEITERRFARWRMGTVMLNRVNLSSILRFSERAELDPFSMTGPTALALLEDLADSASIVSREGGSPVS